MYGFLGVKNRRAIAVNLKKENTVFQAARLLPFQHCQYSNLIRYFYNALGTLLQKLSF